MSHRMLQKTSVEAQSGAGMTEGKVSPVHLPSSPPQYLQDHSTYLKPFLAQEAQPEKDSADSHKLFFMRMLSPLAARASNSQ